ncbi:DMT family transporter [Arthrobacter sp. ISL-5]|uniref:DMT family transporter n=1 Tax=Arthrobacter sp. ISL-5 TaxID=2819111 RepID=UPI0027E06E05|nr:DMT family transporter [Arthrobacter sp. ISL-5]
MNSQVRARLMGAGALAATVVLWSSFALSAKGIGASSLTTIDVALIRFLTPAVLLSPWIPRTVRALRRERPGALLLLLIGGLPHFLLFAFGAHLTTAGLTGLLVPGTVPLFVTAIAFIAWRSSIPGRQLLALGAIVTGVAASAFQATTATTVAGIGVLLAGGLAWALFTIGLRRTQLDPIGVVVLICAPSALAAAGLAISGLMPSHLTDGTAKLPDVLLFTALQGVGTGLLSTLCYAYAVRSLGSNISAATGAMSPVLTAVVAVPLFGEHVTPTLAVALSLIVAGVITFNLTPTRTSGNAADGRVQGVGAAPGRPHPAQEQDDTLAGVPQAAEVTPSRSGLL